MCGFEHAFQWLLMTAPNTGWPARLLHRMARCLLWLGLVSASASACASAFVAYDFSSTDGGIPVVGTFTFSADMPITDRRENWVSYQPSAVVSLSFGEQTWSNAAAPNGYCDVWFHVGWIQVTVWCKADDQLALLGYHDLRIDFVSDSGQDYTWDPDPIGPFTPETFRDQHVRGSLINWSGSDPWIRSLRLDEVRITPFVDEPSVPALLVIGAAGWLITRRWSPARSVRPQD
ncbi:MAG: hypothetical protein IPO19_00150 [Rhodoferax sp.]|nr:hypothetical protein [Rhodoferax sp.]